MAVGLFPIVISDDWCYGTKSGLIPKLGYSLSAHKNEPSPFSGGIIQPFGSLTWPFGPNPQSENMGMGIGKLHNLGGF